jgi:DNA helicase-2/ATP-dependent DNA helicase PcrA
VSVDAHSVEHPSGLNPEQQRAVDHGEGPLMILAGAGTGKTRVLVHRIARLVRGGISPRDVLAVTFTNKAAGEMRERLRDMLGHGAGRMWIGTFHSTCARLLRIHGDRVGLTRDFTIFDDDDQKKLFSQLLKEHGLDDAITPRGLASRIDRAKNRGEDPTQVHTGSYADDIVKTIYPLYAERLFREDAVDFNDLLLKVLELGDDAEVGPILADAFRFVLVDEFQDTNLVQYRLVRNFVRLTRNLTVVGDDDQSIYSWRGAEPRNLLDFDTDFPDATVIKLEQNYRSTSLILKAANGLICDNYDRRDKALWTSREGGDPILWEETADERHEADFIARAIAGLVNEEDRSWGDVSVLYRTHAQSRVLEEQLRRYRIDYKIVGGVSFFQRKEVKDSLAYLRLLSNSAADSSFLRIVNVPSRGIGKTTIDRVRAHAKVAGLSLLDAARSCSHGAVQSVRSAARKRLAAFVDIIDGLRDVHTSGASVAELIIQTVERSGYRERLEIEDSPESRDRLANLAELVSMASDFDDESDGKGTLVEFHERISLSSANDNADGRTSSVVTLMTIHAAKGLEFPIVFLCGMEDGMFPSLRERDEQDETKALEEERRLGYVAITRAMDRLVLTSARTRRVWGEVKMNRPSRFIDSIPSECLAVRARPEPVRVEPRTRFETRRRKQRGPERSDFDQRTEYDDVPVYDADGDVGGSSFDRGAMVSHSSFGTGKVLESRGEGADQKLLIQFPAVGLKTILARFVEPA